MFQSNANLATEFAERRRAERDRIFLKTQITWVRNNVAPVTLVDISETGFHARTQATFAKNDRLRIMLPLVDNVPAEIAWNRDGYIGCRFIYHFEAIAFRQLVEAIRTAPRPDSK
ncbi:MAG: PilZ domain-containing protein [Sphingobium sp.]